MITNVTPVDQLKQIFIEMLLNNTDQVSKVSPNSVLNAIGFGVAKVGQRALKDIALVEAHLFPDSAHGEYLDQIALNFGIAPRFGALGSSTYLRLVGSVGTTYRQDTHTFTGNHGVIFQLENNVTIGPHGYTYTKVRSTDSGVRTNVDPLTINRVNSAPVGHSYVINEYQATGGRDIEGDESFRNRIKNGANLAARGTIEYITQVFHLFNPNILRVFYHGINQAGQTVLAIATQNGVNLSSTEIDQLLNSSEPYLSLTELRPYGVQDYGIKIVNIQWQPIDVSFRVQLYDDVDPDQIRVDIQSQITKYLDFRLWEVGGIVEWDNLLEIVKSTRGVKYVPDVYFTPGSDITIDRAKLPRLRGFLMLDLVGNIISNIQGTLNPVYYPNNPDFSYQSTIIRQL